MTAFFVPAGLQESSTLRCRHWRTLVSDLSKESSRKNYDQPVSGISLIRPVFAVRFLLLLSFEVNGMNDLVWSVMIISKGF